MRVSRSSSKSSATVANRRQRTSKSNNGGEPCDNRPRIWKPANGAMVLTKMVRHGTSSFVVQTRCAAPYRLQKRSTELSSPACGSPFPASRQPTVRVAECGLGFGSIRSSAAGSCRRGISRRLPDPCGLQVLQSATRSRQAYRTILIPPTPLQLQRVGRLIPSCPQFIYQLVGPSSSIWNNVRRVGSSSLPRPCCRLGLQLGRVPNTSHSVFARFECTSALGWRHSTASSGQRMTPPLWVEAYSWLSLGHGAWRTPW